MLPTLLGDKTGPQLVKAGEKFGAYLARVFGSIPEDALGLLVGDWLQHKRRRNLAQLQANTARILEEVDPDRKRLSEPSPSRLIPLLQAATDESREELQELWAALLANLMVDGGKRVRRAYFELVKEMEPQDVIVLTNIEENSDRLLKLWRRVTEKGGRVRRIASREEGEAILWPLLEKICKGMNLTTNEYLISVFHLKKLGCIEAGYASVFPFEFARGSLTVFGRGLLEACRTEVPAVAPGKGSKPRKKTPTGRR